VLYLAREHLLDIGIGWRECVSQIEKAVRLAAAQDCAYPIKPYLRYKDPTNRIIAMPAYVGGDVHRAGIKWIASFPNNPQKGLSRAHSVVVINDADTGVPLCIINSALLSEIRTAAVSGLMIRTLLADNRRRRARVGIVGLGPIGRMHLDMIVSLFPEVAEILAYDISKRVEEVPLPAEIRKRLRFCGEWNEAYAEADVFLTCTTSPHRYIDRRPKPGTLLLNVSLRDYSPEVLIGVDCLIVDDWDEVCRDNTDIEVAHKMHGLTRGHTRSMADIVCTDAVSGISPEATVMFNPMGLAIFDIAIAASYYTKAKEKGVGVVLN
jgi:2,3-diaminopropionate biosynthesis protein SbnB